jgi:chromosome segregation ATPase
MSKIQELRNKAVRFQNLEEHSKHISRTIRSEAQLQNDYLLILDEQRLKTEELDKKLEDVEKRAEELNTKEIELNVQKQSLLQEQEAFAVLREDFETAKEKEMAEIYQLKDDAKNELVKSTLLAGSINNDTVVAKEELNSILGIIEANKTTLAEQSAAASSELDEKGKILSVIIDDISKASKFLESIETSIRAQQELFDSIYKSETTFLNSINERKADVEHREKNVKIHEARISALYKKHFNKEIKFK